MEGTTMEGTTMEGTTMEGTTTEAIPPTAAAASNPPPLLIQTGNVAEADRDVFISVDSTIAKLRTLMANTPNDNVVFIRAGVACGKSTLVRYMVENFPEEFVELQPSADDIGWYHNIIEAAGYDGASHLPEVEVVANNAAVKALKQIARANKTIVIDEAHRLFSSANANDLVVCQPNNWSSRDRPRVLLFSAAATGLLKSNNALIGTPKEINAKFMWYPPIPDMHELSELLKRASVYLSADSLHSLYCFAPVAVEFSCMP